MKASVGIYRAYQVFRPHRYSVCIRQEEGFCCVQYLPCTDLNSFTLDGGILMSMVGPATCLSDRILIPGGCKRLSIMMHWASNALEMLGISKIKWLVLSKVGKKLGPMIYFGFGGILGSASRGRISRLPEQPCWLYALIALQQYSPLPRKFYQSGKWLSSRCLTSVIVRELVFPPWHQPLTSLYPMDILVYEFMQLKNVDWPVLRALKLPIFWSGFA